MGDFRMVIEAQGGHGCDRKAKNGDQVMGCGKMDCPDCLFAAFVSQLTRSGMKPAVAVFEHWPSFMRKHVFTGFEGDEPRDGDRCLRCNVTFKEAYEATVGANEYPAICRSYTEDREVIDDYSERAVKYPTGGFLRATGVRVKGHF